MDTTPLMPPGIWRLDAARSRLGFAVRKHGFGTVHGRFAHGCAEIAATDRIAIDGAVAVASIDTGSADRDAHLRGAGFFAAEEYPVMAFAATRVEARDFGWDVSGRLEIRGVTRAVTLRVQAGPDADARRRRLQVAGEIDRREFGLCWNRAVEASGVVGTRIRLELEVEFELVCEDARMGAVAVAGG
jgi:polyisoprenoid-binding protein YceI